MAPRAGSEQAGPPRCQPAEGCAAVGWGPCPQALSAGGRQVPGPGTLGTFPHRVPGNWCSLLMALGKINKPNENKTTEINM